MPKKKTKSRDAQGAKAKDGKGNVDEVSHELDCRFCDFTADSEKILRKHIRSEHVADASESYYQKNRERILERMALQRKAKNGKGNVDEVRPELDCRFCDFTTDSEKILGKHIRSKHVADASSEESLWDTTPASFAVSAFSLNRLRDPASTSSTSVPSKHMELLLRMARLGRTHSVVKLLLMYIEHPHIIGCKKLSIDSLVVMVDSLLLQACAVDEETKLRLKSAIEKICDSGPSEKVKWNDAVYPR